MFRRELQKNPERGSITVFFVLFVLIASAAVTYAIYVGRSTEEKMRTDTAADLAALAMAQHASMGLNMFSVNNLAIGGNLHVGASIPFFGRYYAILKAFDLDAIEDLEVYGELMAGGTTADNSDFGYGFDKTKELTGRFVKNAAGLTTINRTLANHWLKAGLVKGVEQLRLNEPANVGLMFQASTANSASNAASFYNMKFKNLAQSSPRMTMCQSIHASDGINDRNRVSFWLGGVIHSLGPGAAVDGILSAISSVEGLLQSVSGTISSQVGNVADQMKAEVKTYTGGLSCGDDFSELSAPVRKEAKARCKRIAELEASNKPGSLFPQFSDCGLAQAGNFGEQFENFTQAKGSGENEIGFIFANVQGNNLKDYEDSLQFAAAVGNPLYLFNEMPSTGSATAASRSTTCPADWTVQVNGHQYCSLMLDGIDFGSSSNTVEAEDRDLASGGVGRAVGSNGGQDQGALNGIWSRVQWSLGQAKAEYEPGDADPNGAELTSDQDYKNANLRANKRRMQFFWPAWKARLAEPTVLDSVLKLLGNR